MLPDDVPTTLPPAPATIETALHDADANAAPITVTASFVLHYADGNVLAACALLTGRGIAPIAGTEICVNEWPVLLISAECAIGRAVATSKAGLGDCLTIRLTGTTQPSPAAQIVSWNGSSLLTRDERADCLQQQEEAWQSALAQQKERQQRAARRAKEDGIVAELRARRRAKEATGREK